MLDTLWRDLRYAARSLRRSPGFALTAVLTLALGIGANVAIFSVFDAVLLRPLPYSGAERLYVVQEIFSSAGRVPANALHYREWRASARSFENMALIGPANYTLRNGGGAVRVQGARVTPSLFDTLGVTPALGRLFRPEEDEPGRDRVVVLGHDAWMQYFGGDRTVVGRTISLDDEPHEIIGVLPDAFGLPKLSHLYSLEVPVERPEIWKPFAATERDLRPLNSFSYIAIAKLKPGVSAAQALDDLDAVQRAIAQQAPEPAQFSAALVPLQDQIVSRSRTALQLLLAAVAMVLLIACVNITNLLLARGGRRQREFAIRRAAGADQRRLMLQLLAESLALSAVAGVAGLALGSALVRLIQLTAPVDVPRILEATLDARVLLFTFVITTGAGVVIGLIPGWRATRTHAVELLRGSASSASTATSSGPLRSALVGVEVAAGTVCLIAAVLILTSFSRLLTVERGFDADDVVTADFVLLPPRYDADAGIRFVKTVTERLRALPGVTAVGATDALPLTGVSNSAVMVEGTNLPRQQRPAATIRFADPGYFEAMGMRRVSGRLLQEGDTGVAVVSATTAARLWPGADPIGRRFRHGPDDSPWVQVVGVVNDVRAVNLAERPPLHVYEPMKDYFYGAASIAVKTADAAAAGRALQAIVQELDPELPVPAPVTMEAIVAGSLATRRFQMNVMLVLSAAAAFLAGLGIYGVVSQTVLQRTSELGVRIALGARPRAILGLVLGRAMLPVAAGLVAGVVAALAAGRFLRALLFEVSPAEALPFAAGALLLAGVALVASLIPAYRATRVSPLVALRAE